MKTEVPLEMRPADVLDKSEDLIKITRHAAQEFSSRHVKEKGMFLGIGSLIHHY